MNQFLTVYLLLINAAAFLLMLTDKRRAIKKQWRIPEATLIFGAAAGGCVGAILGMQLFRHKTRHLKFRLGLPLLLILQCIMIWLIRSGILIRQ